MSFPVISSHYMTTTYQVFGKTLSIQSFHLLLESFPYMILLLTHVIPSQLLSTRDGSRRR